MRKIAIVGSASGKDKAPFNDPSWEIWSLNNLYVSMQGKRFTRWFELHDFDYFNGSYIRRSQDNYAGKTVKEYMQEIASLNIPVYMQKHWDIIPKSRKYPFKAIMKKYGKYFGCSFAWMIALALHEHKSKPIDTIAFYGVNLSGVEYYYQRPSTEYMIGIAKGMGINIHIHSQSNLLKANWIYAYDEDHQMIHDLYVGSSVTYMQLLIMFYQDMLRYCAAGEGVDSKLSE